MSTTTIPTPTSRLRCGVARTAITPPVGIYHRMWGAARHDRATGVHRPLVADVMVFAALDGTRPLLVRAFLDMVGLAPAQHNELRAALGEAAGVPINQVVITYSHTHSGGVFGLDRVALPGGELIAAHLAQVQASLVDACREALATLAPVAITYTTGRCSLAMNRDYWDDHAGIYACGANPDAPADDSVVVARITGASGQVVATVVNYACHPTTLAWANTLISPDYVGALREEVERVIGAPCIFALGACGELGPRHGYVGDPAIADKNGRQLAYAALSALAELAPPEQDYHYVGPVISGATLGSWGYAPLTQERLEATALFIGGIDTVDLPLRPQPEESVLRQELAQWEAQQQDADARGDAIAARDYGARAERMRRWLARLAGRPPGQSYPLQFSLHRMGDAFWVTCGGEPYSVLQTELRRLFPHATVLVSPISGDTPIGYLLPEDRYGRGLYQEEPSSLAPGCLETLTRTIATRMAEYGA